jgi:hypothetical protein
MVLAYPKHVESYLVRECDFLDQLWEPLRGLNSVFIRTYVRECEHANFHEQLLRHVFLEIFDKFGRRFCNLNPVLQCQLNGGTNPLYMLLDGHVHCTRRVGEPNK